MNGLREGALMRGRIAWLAMNLSLQLLLGSIAIAAGEAPEPAVDSQTGPAVLMVRYWPPEGRGYSFHPMAVSRLREHLPGLQVAGVGAGELKPGQERSFHLVVLSYPPAEGDSPLAQRFAKDHERWHSYLRSGGGLLVMADENFYGSHRVLNGFMRRFGAELLPEAVADPRRSVRQEDYFRCWFSLTANIAPHPVCQGVKELCYPNGNRQFEGATQAMRLDDTWTVVVRGEASARSMPIQGNPAGYSTFAAGQEPAGEYKESPPLLGLREEAKGRLAFFPTRSRDYFHEVFHPVLGGMCLTRGDGLRLLANLIGWLSEPARSGRVLGGFRMPDSRSDDVASRRIGGDGKPGDLYQQLERLGQIRPQAATDPRLPMPASINRDDSFFRGLVGARMPLAEGGGADGTMARLAAQARSGGYDFLVVSKPFAQMTAQGFSEYIEACRQSSDARMLVIPSLLFSDVNGDERLLVSPDRWPERHWLDEQGKGVVGNHSRLYFGFNWRPYFLLQPESPRLRPDEAKFYSGMTLFTCQNGVPVGDHLARYLQLQGRNYNIVPFVDHSFAAGDDLRLSPAIPALVVQTGRLADVPQALKYRWYAPQTTHVSSGPRLAAWRLDGGWLRPREERWHLHLAVESERDLDEVVVFDQERIFHRYLPKARSFSTVLSGFHDKQRAFTLVARDSAGGRLVSGALYTSDLRNHVTMCTDLQNTVGSAVGADPILGKVSYGGIGICHVGWDDYQIRNTFPDEAMRPRTGIEMGYGGWKLHSGPKLSEGLVASREIPFACGEVIRTRDVFERVLEGPLSFADSKDLVATVDHTGWTPPLRGLNIHRVEQRVVARRPVRLPLDDRQPMLGLFRIGLERGGYDRYVLVGRDGSKRSDERARIGDRGVTVEPGGYLAFVPNAWGAVAVYPIDRQLRAKVRGDTVSLDAVAETATPAAGWSMTTKALFVTGEFNGADEASFDRLRDDRGLSGRTPIRAVIHRGAAVGDIYELVVAAASGLVEMTVQGPGLPGGQPVVVQGLNDKWDAGVVDVASQAVRRIAVADGEGRFLAEPASLGRRLRVGNLVSCDEPEARLSLFRVQGGWQVVIHNPLDREMKTILSFPMLDELISSRPVVAVGPGSTRVLDVPASR